MAFADTPVKLPGNPTLLDLMLRNTGSCETEDDDKMEMALELAGQAAETYIDNVILLQDCTEKKGRVISPLALKYSPFNALTSVTVDGVDETDQWEVLESDALMWTLKSRSTYSKSAIKPFVIEYQAGYAIIPADLAYAIAQGALAYFQNFAEPPGAIKKETIVGVGSIEYDTGDSTIGGVGMFNPTSIATLDHYKRWHA